MCAKSQRGGGSTGRVLGLSKGFLKAAIQMQKASLDMPDLI
jgi:hypothetical protein